MAQFKTQKFTFFAPRTVIFCKNLLYNFRLNIFYRNKNIENHEEVIADFIKQAQEMIRRFEQDGYIYTCKRYMGGGRK